MFTRLSSLAVDSLRQRRLKLSPQAGYVLALARQLIKAPLPFRLTSFIAVLSIGANNCQSCPASPSVLKGNIQQSQFLNLPPTSFAQPKTFETEVWGKLWQTYTDAGIKACRAKNYQEAESMFRGALKEAEKFGPKDRRLGASLTNLAACLRDQGKFAESESLFLKAIAVKSESLGPSSPSLASTLKHYAYLLRKMGRADDAKLNEERASTMLSARKATALETEALLERLGKESRQSEKPLSGFSDTFESQPIDHQITNICPVNVHEARGFEPINVVRMNAIIIGGNLFGGTGQARAFVSLPEVTTIGEIPTGESFLEADTPELAIKYGITGGTLAQVMSPGGALVEVDGNKLFYVCCPINRARFRVGTTVSITQMHNLLYMLQSLDEGYKLMVKELAAL